MADLEQTSDQWQATMGEIYQRILDENSFVRAVFSGRRRNFQPSVERIDIKPVLLKEKLFLQINSSVGSTNLTKNIPHAEFAALNLLAEGYSNILVETRTESFEVRIGKKGQVFSKISRGEFTPNHEHDHKKNRILEESDPFLIAVGISDLSGRIKPSMRDKYRQVEEFLKILERSAEKILSMKSEIRLVDLGCGHAYLTFAAYRYFQLRGQQVRLVGVDIRESSRMRNQKLAIELGISDHVTFLASEIRDFGNEDFDIAIALHACDTATDDALAWSINNKVEIILAAPCCHHDLHQQVKIFPNDVGIIAQDGILATRQLDLLTDELRAQLLRISGYKAEVFEFISGDHTARNLMIRAIWSKEPGHDKRLSEYRHICEAWGIAPALEARLKLGTIPSSD
jgi:SAM-dependent methyltransferase